MKKEKWWSKGEVYVFNYYQKKKKREEIRLTEAESDEFHVNVVLHLKFTLYGMS